MTHVEQRTMTNKSKVVVKVEHPSGTNKDMNGKTTKNLDLEPQKSMTIEPFPFFP